MKINFIIFTNILKIFIIFFLQVDLATSSIFIKEINDTNNILYRNNNKLNQNSNYIKDVGKEKSKHKRLSELLNLKFYASTRYNYWLPSDDANGSSSSLDVFDYKVEGLSIYKIGAKLSDNDGWTPFHIAYESSINYSPNQDKIIEKNKDAKISIRSLFLSIDPFLLMFDSVPETIQNLRFHYRRNFFIGIAETKQDNTLFLSRNNWYCNFNKGDILGIEADFSEFALTIPYKKFSTDNNDSLYTGLYFTQTRKPYQTNFYTRYYKAIVVDIKIDTFGFIFLRESPNFDSEIKVGAAKFFAKQNISDTNPFDAFGYDLMLRGEWHPQFILTKYRNITFAPFISAQLRMQAFSVEKEKYGELKNPGPNMELNMEILADIGIKFLF